MSTRLLSQRESETPVPRLIEKTHPDRKTYQVLKPQTASPNPLRRDDWFPVGRKYTERGMKSLLRQQSTQRDITFSYYPPELKLELQLTSRKI
jgi:hypothetical protein